MGDNLFFDVRRLGACGKNVILGKTVRIRHPELVRIGDDVIIDDFTYISTPLDIASSVHIAAGCKIIGGRDAMVSLGSYSTLAPGVVLAAGSDDYMAGIATPMVDTRFKGNFEVGRIDIGRHCIIGANSVVLPNVTVHDGACLGALSLAKSTLDEWCLYAGIPARKIRKRDKESILSYERQMLEQRNA